MDKLWQPTVVDLFASEEDQGHASVWEKNSTEGQRMDKNYRHQVIQPRIDEMWVECLEYHFALFAAAAAVAVLYTP